MWDFGVITILRGLLLKLTAPDHWQQLISLQSHNEQRKCLERWKEDKILVELIRKTWKLGDSFSADDIFNVSFQPSSFRYSSYKGPIYLKFNAQI